MKKAIGASITVLALTLFAVSVFAIDAEVEVPPTCGIDAGDISFDGLVPGATSPDVTSTISMPTGNTIVSPTVEGTTWTELDAINSMPVGQTRWSLAPGTPYDIMTALTGAAILLGGDVGPGDDLPVYFKLRIPTGQPADAYMQTITFT